MNTEETTQQPSWGDICGWLVAIALPFATYWYFEDSAYLYRMLMVISSAALTMLIFNLIPSFVVGLLLVLSIILLGLAPLNLALSGFSSASFMMAFSFLGLGVALIHSGLITRFFFKTIQYFPHTFLGQRIFIFLTGLLLTPLVPVIPGYSMRINIMRQLIQNLYKGQKDSTLPPSITTTSFVSVTLFISIFLSSSTLNFIVLGLLRAQDQLSFQWLGWIHATWICGSILLIGYMVANWIVYKGDNLKFKNVFDYKKKYTSIEKMTSKEYIVLIAFIVFLIGTLTSSLHKIAPAWIGLLTFTILLFYSSISEKDFRSQIPWDSMVLLGSLSGTIAALNNAGMSTKLAASLIWVEDYLQHNPYLWATLLLGISSGLRFIIPSASITSIMLASIFIPLSYINGVNSWLVCFMIVMFCDCWFFPYQSGECKQLQREQAFQGNDKMKFLIHNAILSVFKIIAIYASIPYWQKLGLI